LVAAVPPPADLNKPDPGLPVDPNQPDAGLPIDLNQPDLGIPDDSPAADAVTQAEVPKSCFKPCRNHCIKMWAIGTWPLPLIWGKMIEDDDGNDDAAFDFAGMVEPDVNHGTPEIDGEKQVKENSDMHMVD
ncbi:hypothetical protein KCU85_g3942, partial [Aureobasidium melanogenum]